MTTKSNYIAFCMDSLRWDIFHEANAPNLQSFTEYKRAYSRAGVTVPSIFSTFMNLQWYESKHKLIPWLKPWGWIPTDMKNSGFHTAFYTPNPMFKLYRPLFEKGFDDYKIFGTTHAASAMVDSTLEFFDRAGGKFVFLLFMETHHPYVHPSELVPRKQYSIEHQKDSLEIIDKEFPRLVNGVKGANTEIIIFSDHGDLDMKREGEHGHGPGMFHRKLFEIPLGRKTI